jgi:hypothetical protein
MTAAAHCRSVAPTGSWVLMTVYSKTYTYAHLLDMTIKGCQYIKP